MAKNNNVVGNYRLLNKIAEGGFGETYRAEHLVTGQLSCVKWATGIDVDPETEALLVEEAKSMWDLRHYGIPAIRDLIRMPDKKLGLVMSYVDGLTLAQIIEKNYPSGIEPEHVAWITERCLNVLKYLHLHGVVHGDVKPQNIIIQPESHTVVLLDYGLSLIKPRAKTEAKGYTPYFCAPEQMDFKTPIPETDLYGLGMTMIFALGGDVAHIKVPETTPPAMCDFIKEMIRRDPMRRPKVWEKVDLCETIREVRTKDFGRVASGMKPLKV
jgi:eukaryotic-like serine/threonine-protein kinase